MPPVAEGTKPSRDRLSREKKEDEEEAKGRGCGTNGRDTCASTFSARVLPSQTWSTSATINPIATGGKSQMGDEGDHKQGICSSRCVTEGSSRTTLAARRSSARTTRVLSTLPDFLKPKRTSLLPTRVTTIRCEQLQDQVLRLVGCSSSARASLLQPMSEFARSSPSSSPPSPHDAALSSLDSRGRRQDHPRN